MKKITSLREVKKTLQRTSPTSAVKSGNFSAEVCQLLTRCLGSRRVADFCVCSPLGETDEWGQFRDLFRQTVYRNQSLFLYWAGWLDYPFGIYKGECALVG